MDDNMIKKVMPSDEKAELSVIGSMLIDREAIPTATAILTADDFFTTRYGIYFDVISEMYNENIDIDPITLQERLRRKDLPEEYTSIDYMSDIISFVPASSNIDKYAEIVRGKSLLRKFIKTAEKHVNNCYLDKETPSEIFAKAETELFEVFQKSVKAKDSESISDVVLETLARIELASKTRGGVTGVPTGFVDLDAQTAGLQPSDLILVAARPSMGKTAFVLNMAEHMAIKNDYPTLIFSLEQPKTQLMNRLLAMHSRIDLKKISTGNLAPNEWTPLMESARVAAESKLYIEDKSDLDIATFRSKCRKYKLEHDIKCVIVDYLQLMSSGQKTQSQVLEIAAISKALKSVAREINCPVIALSQLSRDVEKREDKRPMLSDLRDSGAIEQDADVVMFIYRDDYYNKDSSNKNISEIIIGKQRNGPTGTIYLRWLPEYTRFANANRKTKENGD